MIDYIDEKKDNFMLKYKKFCSTYDANQEKGILFLDDETFVLDAFKCLDKDDLIDFVFKDSRWHYFYTDILDNFDIVESLVQKAPEIIAITPFKYDIEKMRKIVSHEGIDPKIICYVDESVSNDMRFITDVINYTNKPESFYSHSSQSIGDSKMKYGRKIGKSIQSNPMFWNLLNSKMKSLNPRCEEFDVDKEVELVNKYFDYDTIENNHEVRGFLRKKANVLDGIVVGYNNVIQFDYANDEQKKEVSDAFNYSLLPTYGSKSIIAEHGGDYIKPSLLKNSSTDGVYDVIIPDNLLKGFVSLLMKNTNCSINSGDIKMDKYSDETMDTLIEEMNPKVDLYNGKSNKNIYLSLEKLDDYVNSPFDIVNMYIKRLAKNDNRIVPYYRDEYGDVYKSKDLAPFTSKLDGYDIPEDLLPIVIKMLTDNKVCGINCGSLHIDGNYSDDIINTIKKYISNRIDKKTYAILEKENDNNYSVTYEYPDEKAGKYMISAMNEILSEIGPTSFRASEGKSCVISSLVDVFNQITPHEEIAFGVGKTIIPEDLLSIFIKRMVEYDNCIVKCGDYVMEDYFSSVLLDSMKEHLNKDNYK